MFDAWNNAGADDMREEDKRRRERTKLSRQKIEIHRWRQGKMHVCLHRSHFRPNNAHAEHNDLFSFPKRNKNERKKLFHSFFPFCSGSLTLCITLEPQTHRTHTHTHDLHNHKFMLQQINKIMRQYVIIMIICSWYQLSVEREHNTQYTNRLHCSNQKDCYLAVWL